MQKSTMLLTAVAVAAAVFLLARSKNDNAVGEELIVDDVDDQFGSQYFIDWLSNFGAGAPVEHTEDDMNYHTASRDQLLKAFLFMLRASEHTLHDARTGKAYSIFYGGTTFPGFNEHPVISGNAIPVKLPDSMCRAAGFSPGCVSTAAGGYQIIVPTWREVRQAGAWGPWLEDFSPASQDEAARRLLIQTGAMPLINQGRIEEAIRRASTKWASLPGSNARQNPKSMEYALARFNEGLGVA